MKNAAHNTICAMGLIRPQLMPGMQSAASSDDDARKDHHHRITDLGTLGSTFSEPGGINNRSEIAGFSTQPGDTELSAFLWRRGRGSTATSHCSLCRPEKTALPPGSTIVTKLAAKWNRQKSTRVASR